MTESLIKVTCDQYEEVLPLLTHICREIKQDLSINADLMFNPRDKRYCEEVTICGFFGIGKKTIYKLSQYRLHKCIKSPYCFVRYDELLNKHLIEVSGRGNQMQQLRHILNTKQTVYLPTKLWYLLQELKTEDNNNV